MNDLQAYMSADLAGPRPAGLQPLIDAIQARIGPALRSVVLYGSTRRSNDPGDGLVDLMAVVSGYRAVHGTGTASLLNALLPPNVYYLEAGSDDARLRCKYIIVSEKTLSARTCGGLDGYFWARFTQPCRRVWVADDAADRLLAECRAQAAMHFARTAARLGPRIMDDRQFWVRAVRASYGCELRPEPRGAAEQLIASDPAFWSGLSSRLLPAIDGVELHDRTVRVDLSPGRKWQGRIEWPARKIWSRTLNILRLLKAAGTFANGIDYLSWKIERHSGVRIEPTERMRRHPRLAAWGLLFRLWKNGALR